MIQKIPILLLGKTHGDRSYPEFFSTISTRDFNYSYVFAVLHPHLFAVLQCPTALLAENRPSLSGCRASTLQCWIRGGCNSCVCCLPYSTYRSTVFFSSYKDQRILSLLPPTQGKKQVARSSPTRWLEHFRDRVPGPPLGNLKALWYISGKRVWQACPVEREEGAQYGWRWPW